jgi:outer membrane protein assembly factor BamB
MHEVQITNDAESYYDMKILGVYDGKLYIADSCGSMILHEIDLERGTETSTVICDNYSYFTDYTALENGRVYYLHHDGDEKVFGIYDIESENTEEFTLNVDFFTDMQVIPVFIDDMDLIYVAAHNMNYMIDTTNGNEIRVDLPEGANDIICVVPDVESEHVVVANGSDIMFVNRQGEVDYSVSTEGKHPLGIDILTNEEDGTRILVAAYANGSLGRYDPDTGAVIGMTDISSYINHLTDATFQPDWDNGYLYIQFDRLTDVINMDTWYQEAAVTDCFGHHIPTDRFYCTSSPVAGEEEVGYFRHYTVQELVDRAYAIVGEDTVIGENAQIGARPETIEDKDTWGVAVVGNKLNISDGANVAPKAIIYEDM